MKKRILVLTTLFYSFILSASAEDFASSTIARGTLKLVNDISSYLMIIGPIVAIAFCLYFVTRRSAADEHEGKMWNKKISMAIICGVAVPLISGVVSMLTSYYK